jgi:hypothetical protein
LTTVTDYNGNAINYEATEMTQFHEGQEVEVRIKAPTQDGGYWRKAKIVRCDNKGLYPAPYPYIVEFQDGTRAVFDAEHIRAAVKQLSEREIKAAAQAFEDLF